MTVDSVTAALFTWHALKLSWKQRISEHQSDSLLPAHWRRSHSTRQKPFSFHITNEILGLSAVTTTPSFALLVRDTWEWEFSLESEGRRLQKAAQSVNSFHFRSWLSFPHCNPSILVSRRKISKYLKSPWDGQSWKSNKYVDHGQNMLGTITVDWFWRRAV